jgi:hypothetical protein
MNRILVSILAMLVAVSLFAAPQQGVGGKEKAVASQKAPTLDRVSGTIARSNTEKSMLTVRQHKSNIERSVIYSAATKWTKGTKAADMKEFKDGSRVVCVGKFDDKGALNATRIDLQ